MNKLQNFDFNGLEIRTVEIEGNPYFVAKDIAMVLDYSETNAMTRRIDEDDLISTKLTGMNMKSILINESGLYAAIIGSTLPIAKDFKRWVTHEVLPSIRKHGAYLTSETIEETLLNPDTIIQLATNLKAEQQKRQFLEQRVADYEPQIDYLDSILGTMSAVTTTQIAADYEMSAKRLNIILHELGIQHKVANQWILYHKHMNMGYTKSNTIYFQHTNGKYDVTITTKWTQKGRKFIYEQLLKLGYIPVGATKVD